MDNYEKMKEFKLRHGRCRVSSCTCKDLGGWVGFQRIKFKAGKLSADRIRLLDEINFIWDARNPSTNKRLRQNCDVENDDDLSNSSPKRLRTYNATMEEKKVIRSNFENFRRTHPVLSTFIQQEQYKFDWHNSCGLPIYTACNLSPDQLKKWKHTEWMNSDQNYRRWFNNLKTNLKKLVESYDGEQVIMPESMLRRHYGVEHIISLIYLLLLIQNP